MRQLPSLADVQAERCRRDLAYFVKTGWQLVVPGTRYVSSWHIEAIADHLMAVSRREILRLAINIPPRHMKSLSCAVFWPAWEWLDRPHTRWLFACYALQLSERDSDACRGLIKTLGAGRDDRDRTLVEKIGYQGLLGLLHGDDPDAMWSLSKDATRKFINTLNGYRLATSVGGTATGEGGDVIVIDDPHKADEVNSDIVRQGVLDWHDGTMSSRLNDPKTGAEVVIMQRLHEADLVGHILDQDEDAGEWVHLCLPAEYDPKHPFIYPDRVKLNSGVELRGDPRTQPGELLVPERFGATELSRLKRLMGSYTAAGQLQQLPAPAEGGILKRAWWRYHPAGAPWPHFHELLQSWDMAFKDTDGSDYVVGQVWGKFFGDKYLVHQVRARMEFTETVDAMLTMTAWVEERFPAAHRSHAKLVEDKANGSAVLSTLGRRVAGMIPVNPLDGKVVRARAIAPELEAGNVYVIGAANVDGTNYEPVMTPDWVQVLIDEAAAFPNATHDDTVDAMTQALMRLAGMGSTKPRGDAEDGATLKKPVMSGIRSRAF